MNKDFELDLNAYVDGELSHDQEAEIIEAMRNDPELAQEICQLGQLKAQLRIAYAIPPPPRVRVMNRVGRSWPAIAAGAAMLAVGVLSGWILHSGSTPGTAAGNRLVVLDPDGRGQAPAVAGGEETRIVFHLTNPDPMVAGELLDEVETMLQAYQADGRLLRVEVVSHSDGLELLRTSLTVHESRIHELADEYSNLTFVACKNTIERLRVDHGIEVQLVPDAEVTDSGVSHVVRRQQQGWSYIRV
jgi:intracellular sulfur oxidation DsrE/DsrF family protein